MLTLKEYIEKNKNGMYSLLRELCLIPAPSNDEGGRAEFVKERLKSWGIESYIDPALNVVFSAGNTESDSLTVFVAHTDTVFPDKEPLPYYEEDGKVFSPGVGDDTACLVTLMYVAKYFKENRIEPKDGFLFVANSGEEGLGNLKGTRRIFEDCKGRISRFISFDAHIDHIYDKCVGSHRYKVEARTAGGHSYSKFGNKNAIHSLSEIINEIYKIIPPKNGDSRTTYNVGLIEGGTSVNTIAENASMLCEYRSTSGACLEEMKKLFFGIFDKYNNEETKLTVTLIGERPCGEKNESPEMHSLRETARRTVLDIAGVAPTFRSASTDCNIPESLGIPAICVGTYYGGGEHTRGEWIDKSSLTVGTELGIELALRLAKG